jgi:2-dehydro-3-deoxygluconokinase
METTDILSRSKENKRPMNRVITFGEIMLRLAPPGYSRFVQAQAFGAVYGGGEANAAISLANYGLDSVYVTKLPGHEIGQAALNALRQFGVDTSMIVRGGSRLGIYFLEKGASQRPSRVIYDRAHSAIAEAAPDDFDWKAIFEGTGKKADWFHFTGITPAISGNAALITREACKAAKIAGLSVSCDINYRKNLWARDKAREVMTGLMEFVDVCIANEEDAYDVFGIKAKDTDVSAGKIDLEGYKEVAKALSGGFGFRQTAITLRESASANDNNWAAMLYQDGEYYVSKKYPIHIVDRVGGGDSFGAGIIYGNIKNMGTQKTLEFAAAASCLKHTIEGDYNLVSADEVSKLADGDGSGRVQR